MSVVIIAYPPGAGGNHLKNMLLMSREFENSHELNLDNYNNGNREVHSTPGRNIEEYKLVQSKNATQDYLLHGHFGELAPWRNQLQEINKKFVIITMNTVIDLQLVARRQERMGQQCHPYWLHEEQPHLYQPHLYSSYFNTPEENLHCVSVYDLWHPTLCKQQVLEQLDTFLGGNIDHAEALELQKKWWTSNFMFDFSEFEQKLYNYIKL